MERARIQCLSKSSQHVPSMFNRCPVIQPVSSKVRHFSTFFAHFDLPWIRPWDNRSKCYIDGKRIQCWSNALQHVPIYLQRFTSYSEILVGNCNFFLPLASNGWGCSHWNSGKSLDLRKLVSWGYQAVNCEDSLTIG